MATPTTATPPVRLEDYEPAAREILPKVIYDYFAGGAEDEAAVAGNREAFRRYRFRFRVLAATLEPDLSCEVLGERFAMPVHLAPAATQRMAHPDGELAAAGARGVIVSNHGGRQPDYSIATLDALPEVVEAVGNDLPVLLDGGVRRGT